MKKITIISAFVAIAILAFNSCSGCVKQASKKVTELSISAVEGVTEAVDEHGERLAEKTTDAAGKLAVGMGRSLEKQLNEHAKTVASVSGRTLVQGLDGLSDGIDSEMKTLYDEIPHTESFVSGVSLNYIGRYKKSELVDAYFMFPENGFYKAKFECQGADGKSFLTKDIDVDRRNNELSKAYTRVSFALNSEEALLFDGLKNMKITITKK